MRSKSVAWSTLTKSASQALSSSSLGFSSAQLASTCFLQYSITLARILLVTLGRGIPLSAQLSSIMCLIVWDSTATASSTSKASPSELFSVIFFVEAIPISLKKELFFRFCAFVFSKGLIFVFWGKRCVTGFSLFIA